jgi:hypothetical protein
MRKRFTILLILFSFIFIVPSENVNASVNNNTIKSIVQIKCITSEGSWRGSGVIISSDGYVITNKHVVSGNTAIYTGCDIGITENESSPAQFLYTADTIAAASGVDLALLKIKSSKKDFNYIPVKLYALPKSGTDIQALGYPTMGGDNITYTRGYVSGVIGSQEDLGNFFIKADINIDAGNSGGGAFDNNNELLGITSAVLKGKFNVLGLIIPTAIIKDFLVVNSYEYLVEFNKTTTGQYIFNEPSVSVGSDEIPDGTVFTVNSEKPGYYCPMCSTPAIVKYFLMDDGWKRPITNEMFQYCGYSSSNVRVIDYNVAMTLPEGDFLSEYEPGVSPGKCFTPKSQRVIRKFPDGTLIQLWSKASTLKYGDYYGNINTIYLIENGKKRGFVSGDVFHTFGYNDKSSYEYVYEDELNQYPTGVNITLSNPPISSQGISEGSLIRAKGDIDVYIVKYIGAKKFKRLILSPHVFESYAHFDKNKNGNKWDDILNVGQSIIDSFVTSDLVRAVGDTKVYQLTPQGDTGIKRWINLNAQAFSSRGYDSDAIYEINQTDRNAYIADSNIE